MAMRDDNSIAIPLGLSSFNAVKARAKRLAKEIGIPASQNEIQKPQVTNVKEKTKAKNSQFCCKLFVPGLN
ncbi:hypothetical protein BPOR_0608g00020 [Botrytis porri]|uniref:Uncharacterized protein n=1 Tax=Botrytis porri TaxID=87229 RepID=A0A4Z1KQD1_9HELO|nr:hypothetical protein BPOR_0608g00020 [Botrytis porri]